MDEEFVETDEQCSNDPPEQQDDGEAFRIGRVPYIWSVGNHIAEVRNHQHREENWECEVHQEVPPSPNFHIVVTCVDEVITECGNAEAQVALETRWGNTSFHAGLPTQVAILPNREGDEQT